MTQVSDNLAVGDAYYNRVDGVSDTQYRGVVIASSSAAPKIVKFGTVDAAASTGICAAATATGAKVLSATGSLVSGGVATLDVARAVSLTSTDDNSGVNFTITGTDEYGATMIETVVGPNATTVYGVKAFKTVSEVKSDDAVATSVSVGSSNILGFPYRVDSKGCVISLSADGVPASAATIVAGLSTTGVSTATTADVRGTITTTSATPNGTIEFTAVIEVNPTSKEKLYGVAQYGE